jgi:phospholipid/cholesterol/gamma-HCH transport system ATP-binding protein
MTIPPDFERPDGQPTESVTEIPPGTPIEIVADRAAGEAATENREAESRPPYIAFEHVSKSFGDLHVLDDVSFSIGAGETLCILGRSGVGKSVSLQQIMGFLKPDSGRILVAGQDITDFNEKQMEAVRKKVTMVFQNGALFDSLSVGENVAFSLRERHEFLEDQIQQVVNGLLEMVGVSGMADLLPSDLSTGMKRAVAIARALAAQPEAILYDEPTTMVDPLMGRRLSNLIQKLKIQLRLTSVVVTHDMRLATRLADRVLFLYQGKAQFLGTPEEMKNTKDEVLQLFLEDDELVLPVA